MKFIYPLLTIVVVLSTGITALAIANLFNNNTQIQNTNLDDKIVINSINISDPGYECIAAPCQFRTVSFSLTILNSFQKTIDFICLDKFSLVILPGDNQADQWWKTSNDMIKAPCVITNITIPVGSWNDTFTTTLYLSKNPSNNEQVPMELNARIVLGNNKLESSVVTLKLLA